jgi:uncharacterized membrane protein
MKKKLIAFSFILLGVVLPGATVFAEPEDNEAEKTSESYEVPNIDYTGPIDIVSGNPIYEDSNNGQEYVTLSENVVYSTSTKEYEYIVGTSRLRCNVMDGMAVTEGVTIEKDGEFDVTVYRNGEALSEIPSTIYDPGSYSVVTSDSNSERQLFSFQILNDVTGRLTYYVLPKNFSVRTVTIDDKPVAFSAGTVDMTQEGHYVIEYRCGLTGAEYKLEVTVDHTPPNVVFEGLDENNEARGPVKITGMEKEDRISIRFDDEKDVDLDDDEQVTEIGAYHVVVTDPAGNTVEKEFYIRLYLNFNAWIFLIALLLVILGVVIALYIARKKLRVR